MGNEYNNNLALVDWFSSEKNIGYESFSHKLEKREIRGDNREKCFINTTEHKIVFVTDTFRANDEEIFLSVGKQDLEPVFYPFKELYKEYRNKNYRIFFLSVGGTGSFEDDDLKKTKHYVFAIEPLKILNQDLVQLFTKTTFSLFDKNRANKLKSEFYLHQRTLEENFYVSILKISEDNAKDENKKIKINDGKYLKWYLDTFDSRVYTDMVDVTKWIATEMHKNNAKNLDLPHNLLIYGAPGTGKSHYIDDKFKNDFYPVPKDEDERKKYIKNLEENIKKEYNNEPFTIPKNADIEATIKNEFFTRVTFYEDYSYENFAGCYKPIKKDDKITYEFEAGPFIDIYIKAKENPDNPYLLAVEEINRADAAAVFGDLFQVLDRDGNGNSEYSVKPEAALNKYLEEHLPNYDGTISLPDNLYIWATMNSADQGVHVLDSAFKRRWQFLYMDIDNSESAAKIDDDIYLPVKDGIRKCKWNQFRKAINKVLKDNKIEEDRWVGAWFFKKGELDLIEKFYTNKDNTKLKPNPLVDKLLAYLLQDVVKMNKDILFKTDYHNMSSIRKDLSNSNSPKNIFDILNIKIDENALEEVPKTENPTPTNAESAPNGQGEQTQVVTENG